MKIRKSTKADAHLKKAFRTINSAVGEELNGAVEIIERYGRKRKLKVKRSRLRRVFASAH